MCIRDSINAEYMGAVLQLLEYLNIPISEIILDFLLCQLLVTSGKQSLIDLQLKDLKRMFGRKNCGRKEDVKIVDEQEIQQLKLGKEEAKPQLFRQQTKGDSDVELLLGDDLQEVDEMDELEEG
eukprot:TRINITY_DN19479_c0_g1_i1.p3 TRINITY_DN19479_c0_g1~~TRINITY_DN19479_c0_g1_i1.p3  ORF type:complete len:124 (-),score=28.98 TRINITY_DN19479_c0_g1_i1:13-384(-)